ncbi:hypothetical protein [Mycolicibacterium llatzerense]|uniref:hypothetical protein n=1 Tax=Mycolicibacterium llatzerense TaxID=280871 RepID=UPI0021B63CEB|nr:hypothetical protein [Mycolicibacterium llatzerense]MCT7373389.1 hypothetical protein [Mycolicibacterium llatzerense]
MSGTVIVVGEDLGKARELGAMLGLARPVHVSGRSLKMGAGRGVAAAAAIVASDVELDAEAMATVRACVDRRSGRVYRLERI